MCLTAQSVCSAERHILGQEHSGPHPFDVLQRSGRKRREHGMLPQQLPRPGGDDLLQRAIRPLRPPVKSASQTP